MCRLIILERVCSPSTDPSPRAPLIATRLLVVMGIVLLLSGCVTILKPQQPVTIADLRAGAGMIVGRIHLLYNGKGYESGQRSLGQLSWFMTDQTGKRFRVNGLPIDELFFLKVPPGRYRIQTVSFLDGHGKWRGNLQASFAVGEGCTYWGTWDLNVQVGPFTGQVSADVVDQVAEASNLLTRLSESQSCQLTTALLETVPQATLELSSRYGFGD
jgi:hypothetical protein